MAKMTKEQLEARAATSTMTTFEWRLKLLKEHKLYLTRRPFGCGDFLVYRFQSEFKPEYIGKRGSKEIFNEIEILNHCDDDYTCGFNAYKWFSDESIKEVVAKFERCKIRNCLAKQKDTIDAINKLAG